MANYLDVTRFIPTAGGTGDWVVSSGVTGYQTPSVAGAVNGTVYRYRAESADLSQWEVGYGTYTTATSTLTRTTVIANNLATAALINFSAAPQVAIVALTLDIPTLTANNTFTGATNTFADVSLNNCTSTNGIFVNSTTSGATLNTMVARANLTIGASTNGICMAAGTSGLVQVSDISVSGLPALFFVNGQSPQSGVLVTGAVGHKWSVTAIPAANNFGLGFDGTNWRIYNGFASTVNFRIMSFSIT